MLNFIFNPLSKKKTKTNNYRHSERGNVFFTLFGAVAVVGILGAGIMATMRGPLSTMVEVNLRERAKIEMSIASKIAMLDASNAALSGDCDSDGFVEPLGYNSALAGLTGGGSLPSQSQDDPWGNEYGYCSWDAGNLTQDATCTGTGNYANLLAGDAPTAASDYSVIAIISAGPDGVFQSSCADHPTLVSRGGDDLVEEYSYDYATASTGGLWNIKSGTPTSAEIDKNVDLTAPSTALGGFSPQLILGGSSIVLPTDATPGLATCNNANINILRVNTLTDPDTLELCLVTGAGPVYGWVAVSAGASASNLNKDDSAVTINEPPGEVVVTINGTDEITIDNTDLDAGSLNIITTGTLATGDATLGAITAGNTTVGTLGSSGLATLESLTVTNASTLGGNVTANGTVNITNGAAADPALNVSGNIDLTGTIGIGGDLDLANANAINWGDATVNITGDSTTDTLDIAANAVTMDGSLSITNAGATDPALDVTGNIDLSGDLDVGGDVNIAGDNFSLGTVADNNAGNIMIGQYDGVNPPINFASKPITGDAALAASGALTINNGVIDEPKLDISNGPSGGDCLKYIGGTLEWQACSGGGGGDGVGTDGLTEVLANNNDANSLKITNMADPTLAQDAATKNYVDNAISSTSGDRIQDTDGNTYIDVDTTDDGATNTVSIATAGTERINVGATGTVAVAGAATIGTTLNVTDDFTVDTTTLFVDASGNNIGIGTIAPDVSAVLDITSTTSGFLGPRMTTVERDAINGGVFATGLMIYNTTTNSLQLYDGSAWINLGGSGGSAGQLIDFDGDTSIQVDTTGDGSTNTTIFTNATTETMRITSAGDVGIGTAAPVTKLDVNGGIRVGSVSGIATPTYMSLDSLSDTDTVSPSDGDFLIYNNGSGNWEASAFDVSNIPDDSIDWLQLADTMTLDDTTTIDMDTNTADLNFDANTLFIDSSANAVGIGTAAPDATAVLDLTSTTLGFLAPRMTTVERDAIATPATGLMVYNTTDSLYQFYDGSAWQDIGSGAALSANLDNLGDAYTDYTTAYNFFLGHEALTLGATDQYNLGIGPLALDALNNSDGDYNIGIGYLALTANTSGDNNVAIGGFNLQSNISGTSNSAIGQGVLSANTTGSNNIGLGEDVLINNTTGDYNVGIGGGVMGQFVASNGDMDNNTAIGYRAGFAFAGGASGAGPNNNVLLGFQAGDAISTGDNNIILGYDLDPSGATVSNEMNIGGTIFGKTDTKRIGIGVTDATAIDATAVLDLTSTTLGFLPPRMTTVQRDAIATPATGLMVYNTTDSLYQFYDGSAWQDIGSGATVSADSLDWDDFTDTMTLDAATTIDMDTNTADLNFDANTLFIDSSTNFVGIGTNTPAKPLHIYNTNVGLIIEGDENDESHLQLLSKGDAATGLGNAITNGWWVGTFGDTYTTTANQNDFKISSFNGVTQTTRLYVDSITGNIGIGTPNEADASSIFELSSTTLGFLPPRMTTVQRDAIATPATGLMVYNTTDSLYQFYDGSAWQDIGSGATVSADSLDWDDFTDTMTLDAATTIDMDTNTADLNFDANTLFIDSSANAVGIGTAAPDATAVLDLTSTTLGFLGPRMTTTERDAIATPATGLMVYNTTTNTMDFYNGSVWTSFATSSASSNELVDTGDGNTSIDVDTDNADTNNTTVFTNAGTQSMIIDATGEVGIGTMADPISTLHLAKASGNPQLTIETGASTDYTGILFNNVTSNRSAAITWSTGNTTSTERANITANMGASSNSPSIKLSAGSSGQTTFILKNPTYDTQNIAAATLSYISNLPTSGNDTGLKINKTDTASTGTSLLIDAQNGGTSQFNVDDSGVGYFATKLGIGISPPDTTAILDLTSTTLGFLGPRMTTTERDAIATPATGLMVYNTTTNTMDFYNGTAWASFATSAGSASELTDFDDNTKVEVDTATDGSANTIVFTNNTSESMRLSNAGNLGIGTATPSQKLDVNGNIAVSNYVKFGGVAGNAPTYQTISGSDIAANSIDWSELTDTMTLDATTTIDMNTNTADLNFDANTLFIDSSANAVGIGTAAPDTTAILDLTSTTLGFLGPRMTTVQRDAIATPATGLMVYNTTDSLYQFYDGSAWQDIGSGATVSADSLDWDDFTDTMTLDAATTIDMDTNTADLNFDSDTFVIDSTNNRVGIGTNAPGSELSVSNNKNGTTAITITNVNTNASAESLFAAGSDVGSVLFGIHSNAYAYESGAAYVWNTANTPLYFGTNNTERLRIDKSGNVGIGTTTPQKEIHLHNTDTAGLQISTVGDDTGDQITLDLLSAATNGSDYLGTATSKGWQMSLRGSSWGTAADQNDLAFTYWDGSTWLTPLNMDSASGNIGMGTSTPAGKLHIYDSTNTSRMVLEGAQDAQTVIDFVIEGDGATNVDAGTAYGWQMYAYNSAYADTSRRNDFGLSYFNGGFQDFLYMDSETLSLGVFNTSPDVALDVTGDIEYTGTITDVSDRRLKENIAPLNAHGALIDRLQKIDTYSFTMKDDKKGRTEFGVMAQELEKIFPELVHTAKDKMGTKSVNYVGLIAPMIEATKELKAENDELKAELAAAKAQQNEITATLANMQKDIDGIKLHTGFGFEKASVQNLALMLLMMMFGGFCVWIVTQRKSRQL